MRIVTTTLIATVLAASSLAGSDTKTAPRVEESRALADFSTLRSEGAWVLDVKVGPAPSLKIIGDAERVSRIETRVDKGELLIRYQQGENGLRMGRKNAVRIEVTVPKLDSYRHEGVGQTVLSGLHGERFSIDFEGAGELIASGTVKQLQVDAEGAGSLELAQLKANDVAIDLEGVGSVALYASESLSADVGGIGSLTYYGNPKRVSKSVSGIGSVQAGK